MTNRSHAEQCTYLLKCVLSYDTEIGCPCEIDTGCAEKLKEVCQSVGLVMYPLGAVMTPYPFFLSNSVRNWRHRRADTIVIRGTVRCQGSLVTVEKSISFDINLSAHQMSEDHICRPFLSNISSSLHQRDLQTCDHTNQSTDICNEWNRCLSVTRINDGWENCLNRKDELEERETEIQMSCGLKWVDHYVF